MKTSTVTITAASVTEYFDVADYTDAVIRLSGIWNGNVEFYATNNPVSGGTLTPIAVQDIESTNWTTAVTSEAGSSPSTEFKIFRVPVAGLTRIAVTTASGFSGVLAVMFSTVSNTNSR